MEQAFQVDDYVAQEQLFFGLDDVQRYEGMQYADAPNSRAGNQLQHGVDSYGRLSTSPDFVLYQQTQLASLNAFQEPVRFHHGYASPFFQSPQQSIQPNFSQDISYGGDFTTSWNSPQVSSMSPAHAYSNPVDIPMRAHPSQVNNLTSPTSTTDISFFSIGSCNSSYTSMSRTESMPGSVASFDTAIEEPVHFGKKDIVASNLGTSPFNLIQYQANDSTNRLTPAMTAGGKRLKGRRGPLNYAQRLSTAHMRNVGACASCRARKARCDAGIPCQQCINYFKGNLIHHPCRDQRLEDIADKVLKGPIFPRKRTLGTDFGVNFRTQENFSVYLSFGFGEPFAWSAQVASPYASEMFARELRHEHVMYRWTGRYEVPSERTVEKHWVFPALLATKVGLQEAVDAHLTSMVDNPANFAHFPTYKSPLAVLKEIYRFYCKLNEGVEERPARQMLGQAFKLLNLIHIGGDVRLSSNSDCRRVLDRFFGPHMHESLVIPCYIRSQLGEVFSKLASEYMKDVLQTLEVECLNKNCARFPVIVATFIVVFMAIESVQHKTQKDPFHSVQDDILPHTSTVATPDDIDGMVDLLGFYKNCFGRCHRERLLGAVDVEQSWPSRSASASVRAGEQLIAHLRDAIQRAKPYLVQRSKESLITSDVTVYFDRLVARLLLLEA